VGQSEGALKRRKFRYELMHHRSIDGGSFDDWSKELDAQIIEGLRQALPHTERKILEDALLSAESFPNNDERRSELSNIFAVLDEYIIDQAATVGCLIYKSSIVFGRMVLWERARDSKKFVVLARAVGKAVDRLAGTEKVPIVDPFWHANKKQCVADLAHLFTKLSKEIKTKGRIDLKFATNFMEDYIAQHQDEVPYLAREADMLVANRRRPGSFYDYWMGWRTDWDPEKLRQKISSTGRHPRDSSQ
jgi:hypothetical protein